jgi:hypothetical protein
LDIFFGIFFLEFFFRENVERRKPLVYIIYITFVVTETKVGLCLSNSLTTSGLLDWAAK